MSAPVRPVLSTTAVARQLGVSTMTVRRWADSGQLAHYRTPGGQRRFTREGLERFIAAMRERTSA